MVIEDWSRYHCQISFSM